MADRDKRQTFSNENMADVLRESRKRFGNLLGELCEVSGFTQGKLSREAKLVYRQMVEDGNIHAEDPVGSMEQPTISKVIAGVQDPTYFQVYIWLRVIRKHIESDQFAKVCKDLKLNSVPTFSLDLELDLWRLAHFTPPSELLNTYEKRKNLKLIEIYEPLIDHKEVRWDRGKRRSQSKSVKENRKSSIKAVAAQRTAGISKV
jgi:hypothetical protein